MQNLDFLKSLPKQIFAVSGSYWLKLHDPNFREPKDIDISLIDEFIPFIVYNIEKNPENKYTINEHYELGNINVTFADGSKLDIIPIPAYSEYNPTKIWEFQVVPMNHILKFKAILLNQYEPETEQYIKHAMDLAYFIKTWKIKL